MDGAAVCSFAEVVPESVPEEGVTMEGVAVEAACDFALEVGIREENRGDANKNDEEMRIATMNTTSTRELLFRLFAEARELF